MMTREERRAEEETIARYARLLEDGPVEILDLGTGRRLRNAFDFARWLHERGVRVISGVR